MDSVESRAQSLERVVAMSNLKLSLEHMTVLGMSPEEIISTAEDLQVEFVSLILDSGSFPLPLKSFLQQPALTAQTRKRLEASAVRVHAAEGVVLEEKMDFARAERPERMPVVLSREEVKLLLGQLEGTQALIGGFLYGTGLRLLEGLRLRVHPVR